MDPVETTREHDRGVLVPEITAYASKKCMCRGSGTLMIHTAMSGAGPIVKNEGTFAKEKICSCAMRRFMKKHEEDVLWHRDNLYWLPGKAPTATT